MTTETQDLQTASSRRPRALASALGPHRAKIAIAIVLLSLIVFATTQSPVFLTPQNLINVATQISVLAVLASGTTMLMVSRGMDLSIGSSVSLSGMLLAFVMVHGFPIWIALLLCLVVATAVGSVNGVLASFSKTHPFVITLGGLTLVQGLALLVSQTPLYGFPQPFLEFGRLKLAGIPIVVVIATVVVVAVHVVLKFTVFGRWLYAIGGSEVAARLAGIPVRAIKIAVYTINGALVGLAAILLVGEIASASATMGSGLELTTIAAVAVGGTTLAGGRGDMIGTVLGVLLLGFIGNALNLMSISPNWQLVLQGIVIVVAVMSQRDTASRS